ncbi:hypothetical protein DL769_010718 [Monosporascus sp. CRB-8-3]|nr:hypothetical protein DL769_010718 [Monosporascus sp. CRB-8-3]
MAAAKGTGFGILSEREIAANVEALIGAGSESTATLLSGVVYLLLRNPDKLVRLTQEVRSASQSEEEITLISVQRLDFMLARLNEMFRPWSLSGTGPSATTWAYGRTHTDSTPQRFLGDAEFATDKVEALQPFSVGTRNCTGRE